MSRDRKKPPDDERIVQAAELRIQNFDWIVVGKKLKRATNTVRRWPLKYPDRWRNAMHLAERRFAIDGEAESRVVLRALLRHKNSKMRWHAAKSLVAPRLELAKIDVRMLVLLRDVSTDGVH